MPYPERRTRKIIPNIRRRKHVLPILWSRIHAEDQLLQALRRGAERRAPGRRNRTTAISGHQRIRRRGVVWSCRIVDESYLLFPIDQEIKCVSRRCYDVIRAWPIVGRRDCRAFDLAIVSLDHVLSKVESGSAPGARYHQGSTSPSSRSAR